MRFKKRMLSFVLAGMLAVCCLAGCKPTASALTQISPRAQKAAGDQRVLLYYGYYDTGLQAAKEVTVSATAYVENIIKALLTPPAEKEFTQLFPAGVTLKNVIESGDLLYITLSEQFLQGTTPAATRRAAFYALVNTVTENTVFMRVQLQVEKGGKIYTPTRAELGFLGDGNENQPLGPFNRQAECVLTPYTALDTFFTLLESGKYQQAYPLLCTDTRLSITLPEYTEYVSNAQKLQIISHKTEPSITLLPSGDCVAEVEVAYSAASNNRVKAVLKAYIYTQGKGWQVGAQLWQQLTALFGSKA